MKKKTYSKLTTTSLSNSLAGVDNKVNQTIKHPFAFKGRKSPEIIKKVIEDFTDDNDNIFDPFMGSGTTLIASTKAKRYFTGIEIDNYTYNVDKSLFQLIDMDKLNRSFSSVSSYAKMDILSLYETECHGNKNYIKRLYFDQNPKGGSIKDGYFNPAKHREIKNGRNVVLLNKCPDCKEKRKRFSNYDWLKLKSISKLDVSRFPTDSYIENSRINITKSTGANKYDRIFSHRNKVALLKLQDAISSLNDSDEKEFLEQVLVSSLKLARIAMYGSSTDILYHVISEKAQDSNVWDLFESQYKYFLKFKKEYSYAQSSNFSTNSKYQTFNDDYINVLTKQLKNKKFDMIFTDFPYTDEVPYLERNQIFRVWLNKFDSNPNKYRLTKDMLKNEMVVSNAPTRKEKNYNNFFEDIDKMFNEFSKHLKDGKNVIIFTKLGNKNYLNSFAKIVQRAQKNGFELVAQLSVNKNDPTMRKQAAFANTPINEILIGFEKIKEKDKYFFVTNPSTHELVNFDDEIDRYVFNEIRESSLNQIFLPDVINYLVKRLESKYKLIATDKIINKLKSIIYEDFHVTNNQNVILDSGRLYLGLEKKDHSLLLKLMDWIPIYINDLLKEHDGKFVIEDLYIKLIDRFANISDQVFSNFLSDDHNTREIKNLLNTLCDVKDGFYVKKNVPSHINSSAKDLIKVDPYDFERICVDLFTKIGYKNVQEVGGSGDFGVDVVASYPNNNDMKKVLIQCKRWVNNVDATPIQRLHSEMIRLNADSAICITTANYTKDAKKDASQVGVGLINGKELLIKLNNYFPGEFYNSLIL